MTKILGWVAAHYAGAGKYLLGAALTLLIANLGTALPQVGLTARWPRWLAACTGLVLVFFGTAVAIAKLIWPNPLVPMSWFGPPVIGIVGLLLMGTAWLLDKYHRRRTRRRLAPMVNAAWRTIERVPRGGDGPVVLLRTQQGRPVVGELLNIARRRRVTPVVSLTAPNGAGKTATLLEVAARCHSMWINKDSHVLIPIYVNLRVYVNLRGLAAESRRISLRDFVLSELAQDVELTRRFGEAWRDTKLGVTWLFLFDNVDRVLTHWPSDDGSYDWAAELADFVGANGGRLQAVLAGRRMPDIPGGTSVAIAPPNRRSRDRLLTARDVAPAQQAALNSGKSFRQYADNLEWLDLISSYLAQQPSEAPPEDFYDLMAHVIARIISSQQSASMGISGRLLHQIAEATAVHISRSTDSSGASTESNLINYLTEDEGHPAELVRLAIAELSHAGLMASYRDRNGCDCFEFRHDSVQAYFLTCRLLSDPSTVDPKTVLTDLRCPTIAISLLQHGDAALVARLANAALATLGLIGQTPPPPTSETTINRFLRSVEVTERDSSEHEGVLPPWPVLAYLVLHIFDAGFQRHPALIPETLRGEADRLVAHAFSRSARHEQAQMIEIQNLAHDDVAAATCAAGLRSKSGSLVHAAAVQVATRSQLLGLLVLRDRIRFVLAISIVGLDSWTTQHTSPAYGDRLTLASYSGIVTSSLFAITFGLAGIVDIATQPDMWASNIIFPVIAIVIGGAVFAGRRSDWAIRRLLANGAKYPFGVTVALAVFGSLGVVSTVLEIMVGHFPSLLGVMTTGTCVWPICALYYLAIEKNPTTRRWMFPFTVLLVPAWKFLRTRRTPTITAPSKRQLAGIGITTFAVADIVLLGETSSKGWDWHGFSRATHPVLYMDFRWLAWGALIFCILIFPVVNYLHDWRWLRRWTLSTNSRGGDLLEWLSEPRTTWGAMRLMSAIELREPTLALGIVNHLTDLYRILKWVSEVGSKSNVAMTDDILTSMPSLLTPELGIWLRMYDRENPRRLYKVALRHKEPLAEYVTSVARLVAAANLPSAYVSSTTEMRSPETSSDS